MRLKIEIDCDNAAFGETPLERSAELCNILDEVKRRVSAGQTGMTLRDSNGNTVGDFYFDLDKEG